MPVGCGSGCGVVETMTMLATRAATAIVPATDEPTRTPRPRRRCGGGDCPHGCRGGGHGPCPPGCPW
ncbi:hypothetical protein HFP72_05500 [Nocardiopsis sp. ARC36]